MNKICRAFHTIVLAILVDVVIQTTRKSNQTLQHIRCRRRKERATSEVKAADEADIVPPAKDPEPKASKHKSKKHKRDKDR